MKSHTGGRACAEERRRTHVLPLLAFLKDLESARRCRFRLSTSKTKVDMFKAPPEGDGKAVETPRGSLEPLPEDGSRARNDLGAI